VWERELAYQDNASIPGISRERCLTPPKRGRDISTLLLKPYAMILPQAGRGSRPPMLRQLY
jgi:hypothetical protein